MKYFLEGSLLPVLEEIFLLRCFQEMISSSELLYVLYQSDLSMKDICFFDFEDPWVSMCI